MSTKYKILFMVELLNKYYSDLKCTDFKIVPSASTATLLKNYQMVYRVVGNQLVVLVKVKIKDPNLDPDPEEDKPFVSIDPKSNFVFYLDLQNTSFTMVTNLDTDKLRAKQRFFFSNINANKVGTVLNLSKSISTFPVLQPYEPGDLVDDGTGEIFECIQSTGAGNSPSNADFWHAHGTAQCVSAQDMLRVVPRVSRFKTDVPATSFSIQAFGYNISNGLYDNEMVIKNNQIEVGNDATDEVLVDLSNLKPGRYNLRINTTNYEVWVDDDMVSNSFFGVIELYPALPSTSDFDFLNAQGKVRDVKIGETNTWLKYTILYGNRLAYWKYVPVRQKVDCIHEEGKTCDSPGSLFFVATPAVGTPKEYFTSNKPIPLKQTPRQFRVHLLTSLNNQPPLLPNPNPMDSGTFSRTEPDKKYYCTIYLNY